MNVLVIGDWTIDQNWICGIHRSTISSRTGKIHLRGLNANEGATEALCGAGATASVLHRTIEANKLMFNKIVGVGIWHKSDTNYLRNMINPPDFRHLQPSEQYTRFISSEYKTADDNNNNLDLINMSEIEGFSDDVGTTRVIRVYHHTGSSSVRLLTRIDWESTPENKSYLINDLMAKQLVEKIKEKAKSFDAVVIKCLNKKVISDTIVESLAKDEHFKTIPWYISTKRWQPEWQTLLGKIKCRLFFIPEVAANTAKRQTATEIGKNHGTTRWINSKGFGTKEALKILDVLTYKQLRNKTLDSPPLIVVIPSGHRILALGPGVKNKQKNTEKQDYINDLLIVQNERDTFFDSKPIETPFASILFGAMIALDLNNLTKKIKLDSNELIKDALNFTRTYVESENDRIKEPESWGPGKDEKNLIIEDVAMTKGRFDWHVDFSLKESRKSWEEATSGLGVITRGKQKCLELFRASNEVDDYICLGPKKRSALQRLIVELKEFKRSTREKACGCMIVAPPGSGKTRLAKKLAKSSGYNFLPFNITQMYRREHLIDMFDRISTVQAKNLKNPHLVFVDEINSKIENDFVYSAFLAPIEDGVYVRSEKIFHIEPCFWIFAGTNKMKSDGVGDDSKTPEKWPDFESRLTIPKIDLSIKAEPEKLHHLEIVYIGATIIVNTFPDVRWISRKVLSLFWLFGGINKLRMRKLVQFVRSFQNIKKGCVFSKNIPSDRLDLLDPEWVKQETKPEIKSLAKYEGIFDKKYNFEEKTNNLDLWLDAPEGEGVKIDF